MTDCLPAEYAGASEPQRSEGIGGAARGGSYNGE